MNWRMIQGEAIVASEADGFFFFFFDIRELGGASGHLYQDASSANLSCVREFLRLCVMQNLCTSSLIIPEGEVNEFKTP